MRIAQPSGVTVVGAAVRRAGGGERLHERYKWFAESATVYRTARRLMEGWVFVRASALPDKLRLAQFTAAAGRRNSDTSDPGFGRN
jgi:hypothetical protein